MVHTPLQEGYEFNPKKHLPRVYDPNIQSAVGNRIYNAVNGRLSKYTDSKAKLKDEQWNASRAEDSEMRTHAGLHPGSQTPGFHRMTVDSYGTNAFLLNGRQREPYEADDRFKARTLRHEDTISALTHEFTQHSKPMPRETHVYSGASSEWTALDTIKKGDALHMPSYTSTSLQPTTAFNRAWATTKNGKLDRQRTILHFHLPEGYSKGVHVSAVSQYPGEQEFLLDKGQKWKVHDVTHHTVGIEHAHSGTKVKSVAKFISLVPHDTPHVVEQTEHTSHAFRSQRSFSRIKGLKLADGLKALTYIASDDATEQHARLLNHYGERNTSSSSLKDPIPAYTLSSGAQNVNQSAFALTHFGPAKPFPIQAFSTPKHIASVHALDRDLHALSKPLPEDIHTYSGIGSWDLRHLKAGDVLHTPTYTSTSLSAQRSRGFSHNFIIHFHLPKGSTHGGYIAGHSFHLAEKEFLLKRNQKWKVTKIRTANQNNGYHVISVVPHTEQIKEALRSHTDANVKNILLGKSITHKIDAKLASMFVTPHPRVSPLIASALNAYTLSSTAINNALIAKDKTFLAKSDYSKAPERYNAIKTAFASIAPLKHEHHIYSGTGSWNPTGRKADIVGTLIHTPAFVSTSHSLDVANKFAAGGTVIHFHLPAGYNRAMNMRHHSSHVEEHEVLLDHGQTWRVHAVKVTPGPYKPVRVITVKPHSTEPIVEMAFTHDPKTMKAVFTDPPKGASKKTKRDHAGLYRDYESIDGPVAGHIYHLEKHNTMKGRITKAHAEAIALYTSEMSDPLNRRLINIAKGKHNNMFEHLPMSKTPHAYYDDPHWDAKNVYTTTNQLDNIFTKHARALKVDGHFYSGTGHWNPIRKLTIGSAVHTPAFMSTSASINHATEFSAKHIIHFHLPTGYPHGIYIGEHSEAGDENEYLLNRGQKWKYTGSQTLNKECRWGKFSIHTFVPHTDETIKEAFEHDPEIMAGLFAQGTEPTNWGHVDHPVKIRKKVKKYSDVVRAHAKHLTKYNQIKTSSKDHAWSLLSYTEDSSSINRVLLEAHGAKFKIAGHGRLTESQKEHVSSQVAKLDKMMETAKPLKRRGHFYSGTTNWNPVRDMQPGATVHTPAYMSTSANVEQASNFISTKRSNHIIHFDLPEGYKRGSYIGHRGWQHTDEQEFLLHRNQKWKYVSSASHESPGRAGPRTMHIHTFVPHTDEVIKEAYEHNPRVDLNRRIAVGRSSSWEDKHDTLVRQLKADQQGRREEEHDHLSDLHNHFKSPTLRDTYTHISSHINYHLLEPESTDSEDRSGLDKTVANISKEISRTNAPLDREHHVYSGVSRHVPTEIGTVIHMPSFTSTSIDLNVGAGFSARHFAPGVAIHDRVRNVLHFHLPKGYNRGTYLGEHASMHHTEYEYLLDKGQTWKVHHVQNVHGAIFRTAAHLAGRISHSKYQIITLKPHDK